MSRNSLPFTYRTRSDATTWTLVRDVTEAAQIAATYCEWPKAIHAKEAAMIMHAIAAEQDYRAEDGTQVIRAPWVTLEHGKGDCKSTAVLIASMCKAAGRRVALRFLQYDPGPTHWAHVYAVVDGVPVDPLLPLGEEFDYLRCHTVKL